MAKYEVRYPAWHGDRWEVYEAIDHEDAAEEFAKSYNEDGEYSLMNNSIFVLVREVGSEEVRVVVASAEPDIHYSAYEQDSVKCNQCSKECIEDIRNGGDMTHENYCSQECYQAYVREISSPRS